MMTIAIQTPMTNGEIFRRLLFRKRSAVADFYPHGLRIDGLTESAEKIAAFKLMFSCQRLPMSYLFNVGYRYLGQLLVQGPFPSGLMGLIHLSSDYEQHQQVDWSQPFDLIVRIDKLKNSKKGITYHLVTELLQSNDVCLTNFNKILDKAKGYRSAKTRTIEPPHGQSLSERVLTARLARDYAKLSGDYNPIHLHPLFAKGLGLKSSIMHGMYNVHWLLTQLPPEQHQKSVNARFNQPCYLPNNIELVPLSEDSYGLYSHERAQRHLHVVCR
ncbi:MaoC/PaaZ C-terminal domain-containing protein [Thalassotalea euphylliae]|uniref:MaoC/PaaZ C-terminal domain-containing protein n=1 Tax=Thalassotalea euphylliae TaxID=1655234 RepID=UPI003628507D